MELYELEELLEQLYKEQMVSDQDYFATRRLMTEEPKTLIEKILIGIMADYDNKSASPTLEVLASKLKVIYG
jgi:hypothetical protein